MKVCVVGLGYIGLPTALSLAANGVNTVGVDLNKNMVEKLQQGVLTFQEDGLDGLFAKALENGIRFTTQVEQADCYIVAVPTPYDSVTHKVDPVYIINAVKSVLAVCGDNAVVVVESTIPPGTIDTHVRPIVNGRVRLVHAPERIIPGNMLFELAHNARVIGADDEETGLFVKQIYQSFCKGDIVITDIRTAEMSKVVENTYRDINIAFANELARICRAGGMDVHKIIEVANMHPRVNILQPGPGVGGHCISVDPWFLVGDYPNESRLIHTARCVNDSMPDHVLTRIREVMAEENITDFKEIGLYGLSYKEDVDDLRESPTLALIERLKAAGISGVRVFDPMIETNAVDNQVYDFNAFLSGLKMVVVLVSHSHIKQNADKLRGLTVLDTRHVVFGPNVHRL
ncbi:MAG: nucleotide sugar dehydrogenase [Clostridia bacterium]|nr:nucleotide sugar dehydrogenase [Clostridia bacterium]